MKEIKGNGSKSLEYYSKLPYTIIIEQWDDGRGPYWVARVVELPHCIIHGNTPEEAIREIQEVKLDWIKSNLERGLKIPEPLPLEYSGQIRLRISPSLHRTLSVRAKIEGVSLNHYMAIALAMSVGLGTGYDKNKTRNRKKSAKTQATIPIPHL